MSQPVPKSVFATLLDRLSGRTATIGVIGLGYVGLPLAAACACAGFKVAGFDIDDAKTEILNEGVSYIDAVASDELAGHVAAKRFQATSDFAHLKTCDVIVICVPTPLSKHREPDLSYVSQTAENIAAELSPGQLVVLESTTYPGTTLEILKPILEAGGLRSGEDFWLGFSPEREDPGNQRFDTTSIPKVVAGDGEQASELMKALYGAVVDTVVPVSSPSVAEAVKITENVFRAVNIALVNELKVIYDAMGIDVWEVIDAASTKPFGFMPFYPGPGLGGHCIPIDPFYLTWKSREYGLPTRFIELAGEINLAMPKYVVGRLRDELDQQQSVTLGAAHVLVLGLAYKKNVSDIRESPSFALIELLEKHGSKVEFHDPHVDEIPMTREHADLAGRKSSNLTAETIARYNVVLVATDHDAIDYQLVANSAKLIVDTRNAFAKRGLYSEHIVKA
ncbi:MAG: nucleotide sugar dehydrogenase [Anderseniella sp.]